MFMQHKHFMTQVFVPSSYNMFITFIQATFCKTFTPTELQIPRGSDMNSTAVSTLLKLSRHWCINLTLIHMTLSFIQKK